MSYISVDFVSNKLYIRELESNTIKNKINTDYLSKLYIEDNQGKYKVIKNLHNDKKIKSLSIKLSNFIETREQYINSKIDLYNDFEPNYQYISDYYYNKEKELLDLSIIYFNFNINETFNTSYDNAKYEIKSIQFFETKTNQKFHLTFNQTKLEELKDHKIIICDTEVEMILKFIDLINKFDPIFLCSWNGNSFYFPYFINRCKKLKIDYLELSPFKKFKNKKAYIESKQIDLETPIGRYFLDYKIPFNKYNIKNKENNDLVSIINNEFKENKKYKYNFKNSYEKDYQKYIEDSFVEIQNLVRLENKFNYIKTIIDEAWTMGVNFDDVFSTIKPWTYKLYNELKQDNLILPLTNNINQETYSGGYIHKPKEGKYNNIVAFDTSSNYTNIIITNNISYETLVDLNEFKGTIYYNKLLNIKNNIISNNYEDYFLNIGIEDLKDMMNTIKELNLIVSSSGEFFYKNKVGILPKVMQKIFKEREIIQLEIENCNKLLKIYKKELKSRGI